MTALTAVAGRGPRNAVARPRTHVVRPGAALAVPATEVRA